MRLLSILLLIILFPLTSPSQGYGTSNSLNGRWERFGVRGDIIDLEADTQSAWLLIEDYLVQVDFATHTTVVGISVQNERDYPFGLRSLSLAADGRIYALTSYNRFYYSTVGKWESANYPSAPGLSSVDRLVYRNGNGEYLFLDQARNLVRWLPFTQPRVAEELMEQLSFEIRKVKWEPETARLWVAGGLQIGYFENGTYVALDLPNLGSTIQDIIPDAHGGVWIRNIDEVLYVDAQRILRFELPASMEDFQRVRFAVLGPNQALLATSDTKLRLVAKEAVTFEVTDHSDELADWQADQRFVGDGRGRAWLFDIQNGRVGRWEPGNLHWEQVDQWLPFVGLADFMTKDPDGRVWLGGAGGLYAYAQNRWQAGERFYPGLPAAGNAIYFTSDGRPFVLVKAGTQKGFYAYRAPNDWTRLTDTAYTDIIDERVKLHPHDHLSVFRASGPEYLLWEAGAFTVLRTNTFFPTPGNFYDIHITENGTQYIVTDIGVFKRYGSSYELIPLPEDTFSEGFLPRWVNARFSATGTLWIANENKLYKWELQKQDRPLSLVEEFSGTGNISKLHTVTDESILFQASRNVLYYYDGNREYWYRDATTFDDFGSTYHPPYAENVVRDDRGRPWVLEGGTIWLLSLLTKPDLPIHASAYLSGFSIAPNPAREMMLLQWENAAPGSNNLRLFNANGQLVREIPLIAPTAGRRDVILRRGNLPAGVYFLVLESDGRREVRKVMWE